MKIKNIKNVKINEINNKLILEFETTIRNTQSKQDEPCVGNVMFSLDNIEVTNRQIVFNLIQDEQNIVCSLKLRE